MFMSRVVYVPESGYGTTDLNLTTIFVNTQRRRTGIKIEESAVRMANVPCLVLLAALG
jgi:hypothetical protein